MEYCSGGSLQLPYEAGPLGLPDVRRMSTDVAIGLAAMHAREMLHRDIKPSNILSGNSGVTKLGDFGLVTDRLILGYGSAKGYADHVAPEVWTGSPTSAKSDIWALGMTIYRLLHGATFYAGMPDPVPIVRRGGYANRLKWLPHIPKPWKRAVRLMLRDDPADRTPTALAVQNALAGLSTPDWHIDYDPALVRWTRSQSGRRVVVEWQRGAVHHWSAWTEPLGLGQKYTLAGSGGDVNAATASKQLETFFAARG